MTKILINGNEFENTLCKVGNLQCLIGMLCDKIDSIHTQDEFATKTKSEALNACFGIEDYAKVVYEELSKIQDNALDYSEKGGAGNPVVQVVIKNVASFDLIEKLNLAIMQTAANLSQEFPQAVLGLNTIKNLCAELRAACEDGINNITKVQNVEEAKINGG